MSDTLKTIHDLRDRIQLSIIGQSDVIENVLIGLIANGNLLMEGLPGLAKTRTIKALAKNLDAALSRIQFTPDLLPSDVTGNETLFTGDDGTQTIKFQPGPIFANLVLADEINRAPAKVQAALLEAMEERQVTVAGKTHKMDPLFMVMATQNPIEQEGTYPLPEAQMDRFLMKILIDYPDAGGELEVMKLVRGETDHAGGPPSQDPISKDVVFEARKEVGEVHTAENVEKYIVDLVEATRHRDGYGENLKTWLDIGASPRGTISLDRASRVRAWLNGRDFVSPEDVQAVAPGVLRHRLTLSYEAAAEGITADQVVDELLKEVAVG